MLRGCLALALTVLVPASSFAQPDTVDNVNRDRSSPVRLSEPGKTDRAQAIELMNSGVELLRRNLTDDAVINFKQALELIPDFAEAHHNLGLALAKKGDNRRAIEELQEATRLNGSLSAAWLTLAGVYQASGNVAEAINTYREFLQRFPDHELAARVKLLVKRLEAENVPQTSVSQGAITSQAVVNPGVTDNQAGAANLPGAGNRVPASGDYLSVVTGQTLMRWPDNLMPIKVFIEDGSEVPGYRESFKNIFLGCLSDWSAASGGLARFVEVKKRRDAQMTVVWQAGSSSTNPPAEAGDTELYADGHNISSCRISILVTPQSAELPVTDNRLRAICLHEIGHALGLTGHTNNPADIMFYSASFTDMPRTLSQRDASTIKHLYSGNQQ